MCQILNVKQFQDLNALSLNYFSSDVTVADDLKLTLHVGTSPARINFSNTKLERAKKKRKEKKKYLPVTEMRERTH